MLDKAEYSAFQSTLNSPIVSYYHSYHHIIPTRTARKTLNRETESQTHRHTRRPTIRVTTAIVMCWIASHVNIPGNKRDDSAAKSALTLPVSKMKILALLSGSFA